MWFPGAGARQAGGARARATGRRPLGVTPRRRGIATRVRLAIPYALVVLLFLTLVCRVAWIGMFAPKDSRSFGPDRYLRRVTMYAERGAIRDREGAPLVVSIPTKRVAVDPSVLADPRSPKRPAEVATELAAILKLPRGQVLDAIQAPDTNDSLVARRVAPEVARRISALGVPGIVLRTEPTRVEVDGTLARSVLGWFNDDSDRVEAAKAISGIERSYDPVLRSVAGRMEHRVNRDGAEVPGSRRIISKPSNGADVTVTLDRALQLAAEDALAEQVEALGAKGGTVVIGRPATGEVYANASVVRRPDSTVVQDSVNQALVAYEPGSVMKLPVIATAYEQGVVTPESTEVVPDEIKIADRTIRDSHSHAPETMTIDDVFAQSSNVGTIQVVQHLEAAKRVQAYLDALSDFGFGRETPIRDVRQSKGIVRDPRQGAASDLAAMAIGQALTATPMQIWAAYNAVANDGMYVAPRLIRSVVSADGRRLTPSVPEPHRVLSSRTAAMLTEGLRKVVEEGTGKKIRIPGLELAGKTGTAWKPLPGGGYGSPGNRKYAATFVGFFPASKPQFSIIVMIDEPAHHQSGAGAAGPLFTSLANEVVRRYAVAVDTEAIDGGGLIRAPRAAAPPPTVPTTLPPAAPVAPLPPAGPTPSSSPAAAAALAAAGTGPPSNGSTRG
ncbi:MAG: penicillin-binding protein 2 [Microthrixaceae bacterium]